MKKYAYQIDTLRLFAMFLVFATHCIILQSAGHVGQSLYSRYCVYAGYAVEFFVMLSGLLAAYTYRGFNIHDKSQYLAYIRHKALRLFPVHWVCMLLYLPLTVLLDGWPRMLRALVPTALLLQSSHRLTVNTINGASWTISVLFIFYLATPWAMTKIQKIQRPLACLLLVALLLLVDHLQSGWLRSLRPNDVWFFYSSPHSRIVNYAIGLVLGHTLRSFPVWRGFKRFATLLELASLTLLWYTSVYHPNNFILIYSAIVFVIVQFFIGEGYISKMLAAWPFRYVSRLSFSFYMVHLTFLAVGIYIADRLYDNVLSLQQCAWMLGGAFLLSLFSAVLLYELVEKRLTQRLSKTKLFL